MNNLGDGPHDDWAAAVARGEAWTKAEPWATLWRKSSQFAAEEAAEEAAMLRAEQRAAEEAHWAAVADRQRDEDSGWAQSRDAPTSALMSAAYASGGKMTANSGVDSVTSAELQRMLTVADQENAAERAAENAVRAAHVARVRDDMRPRAA